MSNSIFSREREKEFVKISSAGTGDFLWKMTAHLPF
jgi:hypothetical protein